MLILNQCWEEEILATERYTSVQELTLLPLEATFCIIFLNTPFSPYMHSSDGEYLSSSG